MKLLQLYYTSTKHGRSSRTGFQVYAASEGLTEEEIVEMEQFCTYMPPDHLSRQPTEEEIQKDFPISLSTFQLKSGRYGIAQSAYVGKDYSGRYGNFFTHILVVEEGEWTFPPVFLYKSPYFRKSLTDAEADITEQPPPLPPLFISEPNGVLTESVVQNFLQQNNRYDMLRKMVDGLIQLNGKSHSIMLAANDDEIPYWIAGMQLAFPEKIAHHITFTTYAYDPFRDHFVINGVLEKGTQFSFQDVRRRSKTLGFNFHSNEFSEPNTAYYYTEKVIKESFANHSFNEFTKLFNVQLPSEKLDMLVDAKLMLTSNQLLTSKQIGNALQVIQYDMKQEELHNLLDDQLLNRLIELNTDLLMTEEIAGFLIYVSNQMNNMESELYTARFLLEKTTEFMEERIQRAELFTFLMKQLNAMNCDEAFSELFFRESTLKSISQSLEKMKLKNSLVNDTGYIDNSKFYYQLALHLMPQSKKSWTDLRSEQQLFLKDLGSMILEQPTMSKEDWDVFSTSPVFFANIILDEYTRSKTKVSERKFIQHYSNMMDYATLEWQKLVIQTLEKTPEGNALLEQQLFMRLESMSIEELRQHILIAIKEKRSSLPKLVSAYIETLKKDSQNTFYNIGITLQNKELSSVLNKNGELMKMLDQGQKSIVFSDESLQKHRKDYEQFIRFYEKSGKQPMLYEIAIDTLNIKEGNLKQFKQFENRLLACLPHFNKDRLNNYVTWCLEALLSGIYDKRKPDSILRARFIQQKAPMILDVLQKRKKKIGVKQLDYLTADLLIGCTDMLESKENDVKQLNEQMINYLSNYNFREKQIGELLENELGALELAERLFDEVKESQGSSLVRSFKNIFKSKR